MTYQEFINQVRNKAHEDLSYDFDMMDFFPEGYTSDDPNEQRWIKDTNKRYSDTDSPWLTIDMLLLKKKSETTGVTLVQRIAIRRMYEDAKEDGFDAVFERIRETSADIMTSVIDEDAFTRRTSGVYEDIRERLILRPLNYSLHIQDLNGHVYKRFSDFALVLYQLLGDSKKTLTTSKIQKDELKNWNMEDQMEKVMQDALENSMRLFPPCVYDQKVQKEVNFLSGSFTKKDIIIKAFRRNLILLSTTKTTNGALALFYPGVVEKMMEVMGGPFVAVFMNINDIMIFDRNDPNADSFVASAKQSGHMGEMLSTKKYLCDEKGIRPF